MIDLIGASDVTWWNGALLAFIAGGAGAFGKWGIPWAAKRAGAAAGGAFHDAVTKTASVAARGEVAAYEDRAKDREAVQDEKISRMVDEVTIVHELALDAAGKADVITARLDDLVVAVDALNTSGYSTLAELLAKNTAFQANLLELLPSIGAVRRTDLEVILTPSESKDEPPAG